MVGFMIVIPSPQSRGQTIQLVLGFAFCLVCLLFTNVASPFTHDDDDFFSVLCNFVLTASVFLCVVLKQATLAEALCQLPLTGRRLDVDNPAVLFTVLFSFGSWYHHSEREREIRPSRSPPPRMSHVTLAGAPALYVHP